MEFFATSYEYFMPTQNILNMLNDYSLPCQKPNRSGRQQWLEVLNNFMNDYIHIIQLLILCGKITSHKLTRSQLLEGLKCESQIENNGRGRSWDTLPGSQNFRRVKGRAELRDGTRENWQTLIIHTNLHKTKTGWLVHSWSIFGVRRNHGQLRHTRFTTTQTWGKPPPFLL
jgi:hypothetical protein